MTLEEIKQKHKILLDIMSGPDIVNGKGKDVRLHKNWQKA